MEKEFVPYELALELKQLGFDEPCFAYYDTGIFTFWYHSEQQPDLVLNCTAPLYQQAFRWLREKHNLHALIMPKTTPSNTTVYYIYKGKFEENWDNCFEVYEEAELACLKKLIEVVKNK